MAPLSLFRAGAIARPLHPRLAPPLRILSSPSPLSNRTPPPAQARCYTQQHLSRPLQIYRSTSTDPYLNLSIEHHLLQHSDPDSTILFLYTNRPSIIIGRNQNPWLEVNLAALRRGLPPPAPSSNDANNDATNTPIALVRRRSGGGTVFHDAGNANWSVICPPAVFDRDRHAAMVVRALRRLGVAGAVRVNERHDIVMDGGDDVDGKAGVFKVSGSAYKLTRTRSLHHGTCLLGSAYLARVSALLRSPAAGFVKARGVESVRSAIRNVGVGGAAFAGAVVDEFRRMYGEGCGGEVVVGEAEALRVAEVVRGVRELAAPEWIFGQTPQFTFSTHPTKEDPRTRPEVTHELPYNVGHPALGFVARAGLIVAVPSPVHRPPRRDPVGQHQRARVPRLCRRRKPGRDPEPGAGETAPSLHQRLAADPQAGEPGPRRRRRRRGVAQPHVWHPHPHRFRRRSRRRGSDANDIRHGRRRTSRRRHY